MPILYILYLDKTVCEREREGEREKEKEKEKRKKHIETSRY